MILALAIAFLAGLTFGAFAAAVLAVLVASLRLEQLEADLEIPRRGELGARWAAVRAAVRGRQEFL